MCWSALLVERAGADPMGADVSETWEPGGNDWSWADDYATGLDGRGCIDEFDTFCLVCGQDVTARVVSWADRGTADLECPEGHAFMEVIDR